MDENNEQEPKLKAITPLGYIVLLIFIMFFIVLGYNLFKVFEKEGVKDFLYNFIYAFPIVFFLVGGNISGYFLKRYIRCYRAHDMSIINVFTSLPKFIGFICIWIMIIYCLFILPVVSLKVYFFSFIFLFIAALILS